MSFLIQTRKHQVRVLITPVHSVVARHRGRNYVYELARPQTSEYAEDDDRTADESLGGLETEALSVDAMNLGNESRFINHSANAREVNCDARRKCYILVDYVNAQWIFYVVVCLVNDDLKIGIHASS